MSNRKKTKEHRLRKLITNNPHKKLKAQHELSKIELYKQAAALEDMKES